MKMISIPRLGLLALAALTLGLADCPKASAAPVCMNTSNGNGGSIAYYPYLFNNNTFGWSNDKSGSTECLTLNYTNSADSYGVYYDGFSATWNWPTNSDPYDVKAYPSMVYGWQYGYTYTGLGLPTIIYDNKNIITYQTVTLNGNQNEDVLIDTWLLNSPNATSQADEVEIFVSNDINAYSTGNFAPKSIDGVYYQVSSRTTGAWPVYNFIPSTTSTSLTLKTNVGEFVRSLVYDDGVIQNDLYVGGTQIGVEVYHGNGGVTFNPAAISVN